MNFLNSSLKTVRQLPALLAVVVTLSSCRPKPVAEAPKKFCLTDSMMHSLAMEKVEEGKYYKQLQLPGKVTYNDDKVQKIYALVSGKVTEVKVQLGDKVEKGQVLAVIHSTEMAGFSNDLVNARANIQVTRKALDAQQDLYKSGLASERDLIGAQTDFRKAQSDLARITSILSVNGGSTGGSVYMIKAPEGGYIVDKQVTPNTQIRPDNGNDLFMISDLRKVWVMANVYESDIQKVKMGQLVKVTTLSYPDRVFDGVIDKIYNVLDPVNKVMKVRIQMNNADYALKPEMFANVKVSDRTGSALLGIPSKAIIFDNSKNYVLVFHDKCNIETRPIEIANTDTEITFIKSGLAQGDQIITINQLFVYQALNE